MVTFWPEMIPIESIGKILKLKIRTMKRQVVLLIFISTYFISMGVPQYKYKKRVSDSENYEKLKDIELHKMDLKSAFQNNIDKPVPIPLHELSGS